jgi:hypothetical protein
MKKYPDISPLLRGKAARRHRLAQLSFEEKIAIVNKWRKLGRSIKSSVRLGNHPTPDGPAQNKKHG